MSAWNREFLSGLYGPLAKMPVSMIPIKNEGHWVSVLSKWCLKTIEDPYHGLLYGLESIVYWFTSSLISSYKPRNWVAAPSDLVRQYWCDIWRSLFASYRWIFLILVILLLTPPEKFTEPLKSSHLQNGYSAKWLVIRACKKQYNGPKIT